MGVAFEKPGAVRSDSGAQLLVANVETQMLTNTRVQESWYGSPIIPYKKVQNNIGNQSNPYSIHDMRRSSTVLGGSIGCSTILLTLTGHEIGPVISSIDLLAQSPLSS